MKKIKNKIYYLICFSLNVIINVFSFIYEAIWHPIRKISIWLVVLLFWIIDENFEVKLDGTEMFLMSTGLVSIVMFITNYLANQTVDIEKKENYFLGFNIKKMRFHDNFWVKKFNDIPIKLFFWLIAIIPIMIICLSFSYNFIILSKLATYMNRNILCMKALWMSIFAISCFYCIAILIESISLSRDAFSQSYLYKTTQNFEEYLIKKKIKRDFREEFKNLFNITAILGQNNEFYSNVETLISYIFNRGRDVSNSEAEFNEYITCAFYSEDAVIDELLEKVYKYVQYNTNNKIIRFIKSFLFQENMKSIKFYYNIKWKTINGCNLPPLVLLRIAINDLNKLLLVEEKLSLNGKYRDIFWGVYRKNNFLHYKEDERKSNLCISRVVDILGKKVSKIEFLNKLNDTNEILRVFDILHSIDCTIEGETYFSCILKKIYLQVVDGESEGNNFIKDFSAKIKSNYLPTYIINELTVQSKEVLMRGDSLAKEKIAYLIKFLPLKDIISVLIFRLAYFERSHREIMKLDEFNVWKDAVEYRINKGDDIEKLKKQDFIFELCNTIAESHVSHFMFNDFLKWLWSSLFKDFDDKEYKEFIELGEKGIRRNFSLNSYLILRLLLCQYPYFGCNFVKGDNAFIKKELFSIKDILDARGITYLTANGKEHYIEQRL